MEMLQKAVYEIAKYLSVRDVPELSAESVYSYFGGRPADVILVFGNELPQVAEAGCQAWKKGLARGLLFCGGVGHSTVNLRERMQKEECYRECRMKESEAELFAEIAVRLYKIPESSILLDTESTNCGENARNAKRVLEKYSLPAQRLILLQDPLLQRRSVMTLQKVFQESTSILSYAPFLPECDRELNPKAQGGSVWEQRRFLELLLGEIWRLRDDANGYGPQGMGFIDHVDIPLEVENAWKILYEKKSVARKRC